MGRIAKIAAAVILGLSVASCNLFESSDKAEDKEDLYLQALRLASEGECYQARDILLRLEPVTDDIRVALGWAHLCISGATAKNIAVSLYKYTSSASNASVVGSLAKTMLPMDGDKYVATELAIDKFGDITDTTKQSLEVAIARLARAAAILAQQATLSGESTLEKADISTSCSDACTTCNTPGMSDTDVTLFANNISAAASAFSASGAADLRALADFLNSGVGGATNAARCFIYKDVMPAE